MPNKSHKRKILNGIKLEELGKFMKAKSTPMVYDRIKGAENKDEDAISELVEALKKMFTKYYTEITGDNSTNFIGDKFELGNSTEDKETITEQANEITRLKKKLRELGYRFD